MKGLTSLVDAGILKGMTSLPFTHGVPDLARELITSLRLANLTREAPMTSGDEELTPSQVARELRTSASTVRRWEGKGWLVPRRTPGGRHRRYSRADVEEFKRRYEEGEFTELPPGSQAGADADSSPES